VGFITTFRILLIIKEKNLRVSINFQIKLTIGFGGLFEEVDEEGSSSEEGDLSDEKEQ
jgi:hypothetical protein